jgi:hypothetical protein
LTPLCMIASLFSIWIMSFGRQINSLFECMLMYVCTLDVNDFDTL